MNKLARHIQDEVSWWIFLLMILFWKMGAGVGVRGKCFEDQGISIEFIRQSLLIL